MTKNERKNEVKKIEQIFVEGKEKYVGNGTTVIIVII